MSIKFHHNLSNSLIHLNKIERQVSQVITNVHPLGIMNICTKCHLTVVEISQSGLKWSTDQLTQNHGSNKAKNSLLSTNAGGCWKVKLVVPWEKRKCQHKEPLHRKTWKDKCLERFHMVQSQLLRVHTVGKWLDWVKGEHMCACPPLKGRLWWRIQRTKLDNPFENAFKHFR